MSSHWIEFEDIIMNIKEVKTITKKVRYDAEKDGMSYDLIFNDGLNEMMTNRYEFKYNSQEQLDFHWENLKNKMDMIEWVIFL